MSVANTWSLSAVSLPSGVVGQITDQDIDPGLRELLVGGSGRVDPEFSGIGEQKPVLSFTTTAIKAALDFCGINGLAIAADTHFYFVRNEQGGTRNTGSNNLRVTTGKGLLLPRRIRAASGPSPATIQYDLFAISANDVTAPITAVNGVSLPTIPVVSQLYTIGPVGVNASTFGAVNDINIDLGIEEDVVSTDGSAYPTFACIMNRMPKFSMSGLDLTALATHTPQGLELTSWRSYLRRIAPGGGVRYGNGEAQHIKFSGTTGLMKPEKHGGSHGKAQQGDWCIYPTYDGTNPIVVVATSSTIT